MHASLGDDAPIVVIDDDPAMRRACQAALRKDGFAVETCSDGPSGLQKIEEVGAGLIIVDIKMPGMNGMEVIERARRINPDIVAVVITGFATVSTAVEAMKAGAYDFIPKPFTAEEFRVIISRGLERRRLMLEAKQLREEKETQARKFITFVSHQLKSPLGAVQQYLDVLRHQLAGRSEEEGGIPPQQRQWIDRSSLKIAGMLQVIQDWLTVSKVEGGQLATDRVPVRWQELVAEVLDTAQTAAAEQGITLLNELPADLPPVVGDATALRMLVANLVNNAVKYNREGGEVCVTGAGDDTTVTLSVRDNGPGIAPEHQGHVFEEFFRVKNESTAGKSGTGMGLAICRKIAEELGGTLTLSSEVGVGSTFTTVLPRSLDETGAGEPSDSDRE